MDEILPHWSFSPNAPDLPPLDKGMTKRDRTVAAACREAMESKEYKALLNLERLGVRFTALGGVCVREVARIVLDAMPDDAAHETARMQLEHMVKTRDGGETIRIVKTLAVKGRF